eukprot:TRINITY_DN70031_c0_g1_i1.p1 TRINITY_DN70031_c0_g1~~TRINITY_DN70031_c0_g1_i1.p1  ORF type:complete len:188 (+),score=12.38 TRINITY_DN70031_c0_g1_i1:66-566(+)
MGRGDSRARSDSRRPPAKRGGGGRQSSRSPSRGRPRSDSRRRQQASRSPPRRRQRSPSQRRDRRSRSRSRSRSRGGGGRGRSRDKKYAKLPGEFENKTFHGTMKHINKGSGYGFIQCAETRAEFGRDVFVDLQRLPPGCDREGDRVTFKLVVGRKGYAEASSVERD